MIPYFPKFKKLEISDKEEIENFTEQFQPYSDFNFANLWSWDVNGKTEISKTNNALIIKFIDYEAPRFFYSFLSGSDANELAESILRFALKQGFTPKLKLLPQITSKQLDGSKFTIEEDHDNFDYIYDLQKLANYKGKLFEDKRNLLARFLKKYKNSHIEVKILDLSDSASQKEIISLNNRWEENKGTRIKDETQALKRLFKLYEKVRLLCIGVLIDKKLVAFCLNELLKLNYAITHFAKADVKLSSGLYAYLMQANAKQLLMLDKSLLNYQQDLGLSNLRYAKRSFRPAFYLKKYKVSLKT